MYFQLERLIIGLENRNFLSKFDHFETSILTILGVEKVIFWTFSKLFWSCLGSIRALFLDLKGPLLSVFSAPTFDKWPKIEVFCQNLTLYMVIFNNFRNRKSHFLDFSKFFCKFIDLKKKNESWFKQKPEETGRRTRTKVTLQ